MCNTPDKLAPNPANPAWPVTDEQRQAVKASGIFGGGIRQDVAGAGELIEQAQRILTDLETGAKGLDLTIGPFQFEGLTIPAIPLHFKLR